MANSFHQRCQFAVTHPVTLGAVALLLVNDWLLKPLWSSDWTTGKLSDFAWMVFAPPLVLFAFSLLVRGTARAERSACLAAYVGLPLLYAAYNTFSPLHDWIMGGFTVLSGPGVVSTLDPADSLVIPPAMAVALWVWRGTTHSRESLRTRLHLYAVVIAALATVATSYSQPSPYAWSLGVDSMGETVMNGMGHDGYTTTDGGLTWIPGQYYSYELAYGDGEWGGEGVVTPRGTYFVSGTEVYRTTKDSQPESVYSLRYLLAERNFWVQVSSTREMRRQVADLVSVQDELLTRGPYGMVYDGESGNVIVSLGILGVVVGDTNENWTPVAVGPYVPLDRSWLGRARWLFTPVYGFAAVAIPLSAIAVTFALTASTQPGPKRKWYSVFLPGTKTRIALILILSGSAMVAALALIKPDWLEHLLAIVLILTFGVAASILSLSALMAPFILVLFAQSFPRHHGFRRITAICFAVLAAGMVAIYMEPYLLEIELLQPFEILIWVIGALFGLSAFGVYWPSRQQIPAVAVTFVVMNVVMPLPFFLWLLGGINLATATVGSAELLGATGYALYSHLKRNGLLRVAEAAEERPSTPAS